MEKVLESFGVGLRAADDPFFDESYRSCKIFQRKGVTVVDEEELCHEIMKEFSCHVAGCTATFQSLLDFEMHYNTNHRYVCAECKKSLPNPRLLDIHIQETHDSFFRVLSAKQPMYLCFVSECEIKFNDPAERMAHCVSVHKFPKNFRYNQTPRSKKEDKKNKMEIDQSQTKGNSNKAKKIYLSTNQNVKTFTAASKDNIQVKSSSDIVQTNPFSSKAGPSSLRFIPRQVQKSYTKALTKNQSNEKNVLETDTLMDLAKSLPEPENKYFLLDKMF